MLSLNVCYAPHAAIPQSTQQDSRSLVNYTMQLRLASSEGKCLLPGIQFDSVDGMSFVGDKNFPQCGAPMLTHKIELKGDNQFGQLRCLVGFSFLTVQQKFGKILLHCYITKELTHLKAVE